MTILDETDRWKSIDPKAMHSLLIHFRSCPSAAEAARLRPPGPQDQDARAGTWRVCDRSRPGEVCGGS